MTIRPNLYDYLKILALVAMIIDHIWYYLYPEQFRLRVLGRVAFPLFLFLVWYNQSYRWRRNLTILAIIIQLLIWLMWRYWYPSVSPVINILWVVVLTRFMMTYVSTRNIWIQASLMISAFVLMPWTWTYLDYGTMALGFAILGYRARKYFSWWVVWSIIWANILYILLMIVHRSFPPLTRWILTGEILILSASMIWLMRSRNLTLQTQTQLDIVVTYISSYAIWIYVIHGIVLIWLAWMRH